MPKELTNKTAIGIISKFNPRSTDHRMHSKERLFDIEIAKVKYCDENKDEKSRYVCILNEKDYIFSNVDDLLGFIENHQSELGINKSNYLQIVFDNTPSVLAVLLVIPFVFLLVKIPENKELIDVLKYSLGLALGSFFTSYSRKSKGKV